MFSFRNGTALASKQDMLIEIYRRGETITPSQISELENNLWVVIAAKLAPGNLVIRQYALIDLFKCKKEETPVYKDKILDLMDLLSYRGSGEYRIWAEGYSYFLYTMDIVQEWINKFNDTTDLSVINSIIEKITRGFLYTAYLRNGKWYPAPFGDLRDLPLMPQPQPLIHPLNTLQVSNITFNYDKDNDHISYTIKGKPIGLNTHIPKDDYNVNIVDGIPEGFKFYEGYDKKYSSIWQELLDTYNIKRICSIPF